MWKKKIKIKSIRDLERMIEHSVVLPEEARALLDLPEFEDEDLHELKKKARKLVKEIDSDKKLGEMSFQEMGEWLRKFRELEKKIGN